MTQGLQRYAVERFLYRLGRSAHRERFVLKGATLFAIWGTAYRPTRDIDFTAYGNPETESVLAAFRAGTCIDPKMQLVDGKPVCLVSCQRSPEPVYLKWKGLEAVEGGDFFVRSGPGTVKLSPSDTIEYVRTRFPTWVPEKPEPVVRPGQQPAG